MCVCARRPCTNMVATLNCLICTVIVITLPIILGHHAMGSVVMSCVVMSCVRLGFSNHSHAANSIGPERGLTAWCAWPKGAVLCGSAVWSWVSGLAIGVASNHLLPLLVIFLLMVANQGWPRQSFVRSGISWLFSVGRAPTFASSTCVCVCAVDNIITKYTYICREREGSYTVQYVHTIPYPTITLH